MDSVIVYPLPVLPLVDPVWLLAAVMLLFVIVPALFERCKIPGIVGLIVAGAVLGEEGLGVLSRTGVIELLGTGGMLFIMFLVGLELDLTGFRRNMKPSITFGVLSYAVPQIMGTITCLALGTDIDYAILAGAIFGSHTVVAYPIASRLGILKERAVTCALGGTVITNIITLTVLALVAGVVTDSGSGALLELGIFYAFYIGIAVVVLPLLGRLVLTRATATTGAAFVLAALFAFAALGDYLGIHAVIGAMLAGLAFNTVVADHPDIWAPLRATGDLIFVPFFMLSLGMLVEPAILAEPAMAVALFCIALLVVAAKYVAALVTQRAFEFNGAEGLVMFGLSVAHAAATSAIAIVGRQIGVLDDRAVTAAVVIILVTGIGGAFVTDRAGKVLHARAMLRDVN
ncbi:MAG: cation:proton antiporter [Nitrococcus sp.]|nr:cation:proton antiporter [Nitrococcus sp.]